LLAVAGCSSGGHRTPPSETPAVSETPTPTATPIEDEGDNPVLPAGCGELLPRQTVDSALGSHLEGKVTFLNAAPVPGSGRTGRVTCGYGVTSDAAGANSAPLVEVSYITYIDAATAAHRVDLTVANDTKAGSTVTDADVEGIPAFVLTSGTATVLVFAEGSHTFVVKVDASLVPAGTSAPLVTIASSMVKAMNDLRSQTHPETTPSPTST
jgi:hypothetical protein